MKTGVWLRIVLVTALLGVASQTFGQANLEIDTPAIASIRAGMKQRHAQLQPYYVSGAIGLTRDGNIALRDANIVPLAERQRVNSLITADNQDRAALYREIARANGKPEWENDIRATFAQRWAQRAPSGWYYQNSSGIWVMK